MHHWLRGSALQRKLGNTALNERETLHSQRGFALPIALGMGFVMTLLAVTSLLLAQGSRTNAVLRRERNISLAVSEGALARTLVEIIRSNNAALLTRNYDLINTKTGNTYLGPDGIPSSGDEESSAVDEWSGYTPATPPCSNLTALGTPDLNITGSLGDNDSFTLKAYRYNATEHTGTLLIEGVQGGSISHILVKIAVNIDNPYLPGLWVYRGAYMQGRIVSGKNGHVYYDPNFSPDITLTGSAMPLESDRPQYLDAIQNGPADGYTGDSIAGLIAACDVDPIYSVTVQGADLGPINTSLSLSGSAGRITHYQADIIDLAGDDILDVDTTLGPVYLYVTDQSHLRDNAQILNFRTDDKVPQVGDLRLIFVEGDSSALFLHDNTCVDTAFLYNPNADLRINTNAGGCSVDNNTSFIGVAWIEDFMTSVPGFTFGIRVPDDLTSLADLFNDNGWPTQPRFGQVLGWQRVNL